MSEYEQMLEMQLRFAEEEKQQAIAMAYEQGRTDEREKFMWCLEHFDYHMSREELIQKVKEFLDNEKGQKNE